MLRYFIRQSIKETLMRTLLTLVLILTFTLSLSARSDNIIVVGAFYKQTQADTRLKNLKESMTSQRHIISLQNDLQFNYSTRKFGKFYIVTISPFENRQDIENVLSNVKTFYNDAYIHKIKRSAIVQEKRVETQKEEKKPMIEEVLIKEEISIDEEVSIKEEVSSNETLSIEKEISVDEELSLDEAVSVPKEVMIIEEVSALLDVVKEEEAEPEIDTVLEEEAAIVEIIEVVPVKEIIDTVESPEEVTSVDVSEEEGLPNLFLYGVVILVILLLLLILLFKRSNKRTAELSPLQEIQVEDIPEAASSIHVEEAEEIEPTAKIPVYIRKKREAVAHAQKITKDNLKDFKGNRILVAEDNLINQKVISKLLADSGIEIVMANDGQEALDILEEDRNFQVILMDAHMPRIDGFEATRIIRANSNYEQIVVVALSGDVSSDDLRHMKEAGMEEQLAKPLRMDKLYDVLYAYCDLDSDNKVVTSSLQVLNIEEGLQAVGEDKELYKNMLNVFAEEFIESVDLLENYLSQQNDEMLELLFMELKETTDSIGAEVLLERIEELRKAVLQKQTTKYEALSKRYKSDVVTLIETMESV